MIFGYKNNQKKMSEILSMLFVVILFVILFVIGRKFVLWYFKINEEIQLQKETNHLLKQFLPKEENKPSKEENKSLVKTEKDIEIEELKKKLDNKEITEDEFKTQR
jgi:preprotein translocase subunit SecF